MDVQEAPSTGESGRHGEKAVADHGLGTRSLLTEVGRRKMVGGQEDMIVDVALDFMK